MDKNKQDGLQNNPNNLIGNLTRKTLSDIETEILQYSLTLIWVGSSGVCFEVGGGGGGEYSLI